MKFFELLKNSVFYDVEKSQGILPTNFTRSQSLFKWVLLFIAAPISITLWLVIRILLLKYRISIYVLPTFRPGVASMYLSTIEPLCRELQHLNDTTHFTILVNPAETISEVLVKSYEPNFSVYLDDRRKFARLVAYLIPQKGIEKIYLTGKREFDAGWNYRPSKNYANQVSLVPSDLQNLGLDFENYALFVHPSKNYFQKRYLQSFVDSMNRTHIDLSSYEQPLLALIKQGLQIVRVGTHVDDLPSSIKNLPIIDYTQFKRDESNELWLYENCKILISVANGAFWFARRFNRPTIICDSENFINRYFSTFYTPSLLKIVETDDYLSFRQMRQISANSRFSDTGAIHASKFQLIQNSPSTLTASINETLAFADGIAHMDSIDKKLLEKYGNFCQEFGLVYNQNTTRPTISFLREFSHLLD